VREEVHRAGKRLALNVASHGLPTYLDDAEILVTVAGNRTVRAVEVAAPAGVSEEELGLPLALVDHVLRFKMFVQHIGVLFDPPMDLSPLSVSEVYKLCLNSVEDDEAPAAAEEGEEGEEGGKEEKHDGRRAAIGCAHTPSRNTLTQGSGTGARGLKGLGVDSILTWLTRLAAKDSSSSPLQETAVVKPHKVYMRRVTRTRARARTHTHTHTHTYIAYLHIS
jgi:hypothetical protein